MDVGGVARRAMPSRTEKPYGLSAADLKFLHSLPQVWNRNFKSMRH